MRILHVSDVYLPRLGGIELHVHDLATQQRAAGHHVEIVTPTKPAPAAPGPDSDVPVHRPQGLSVAARAGFMWSARDLGARLGFDVVHAHCSTFSPLAYSTLGATAATPTPVPTVITVHSLWRRYTALYRAADLAVRWSEWPVVWSAVSRSAARSVERAAAAPLDVHVTPNGIDLSSWTVPPRAPVEQHLRFASVMRLAVRKRPMALLRMWRQVRQQVPDEVRLSAVVIGDGPARAQMQRYLDRHDMSWVELAGRLPRHEVADLLAASDVYVAPAKLESFGIAALEARAVGLPVIGYRDTGLADFIVDGRDGALCDSDAAMVSAMVRLAGDPRRHRRRPHEVGQLERMSWPAILRGTDELYALAAERASTSSGRRSPAANPGRLSRRAS